MTAGVLATTVLPSPATGRRVVFGMPPVIPRGTGTGWLAGSFPDGITAVDGVPGPVEIRVKVRAEAGNPLDGRIVATVTSGVDGTWLVEGLNPLLRYDVVGRKAGFNDALHTNVEPVDPPRLRPLVGSAYVSEPFSAVLPLEGGNGPVTAVLVGGTLPDGISYEDGVFSGVWPTGTAGVYNLTFDLTDSRTTVTESTGIELI